MSITITRQPRLYNLGVGKNLFTLAGSTQSSQLYIGTIYSGGLTLSQIQSPRNAVNVAHINLEKILRTQLSHDEVVKNTNFSNAENSIMGYSFSYGVRDLPVGSDVYWGTSTIKLVLDGNKPENQIDWNYDNFLPHSNTFDECIGGTIAQVRFSTKFQSLTDYPQTNNVPTYYIYDDEYQTQSIMNGFSQSRSTSPTDSFNFAAWGVDYVFYDSSGATISRTFRMVNNSTGAGPYTDQCTLGTRVVKDRILHIPSGTQNLKDLGIYSNCSSYSISVWTRDNCKTCTTGLTQSGLLNIRKDEIFKWNFVVKEDCLRYEKVRFCFQNKYGMTDYYTFELKNTETDNIQRGIFYKNVGEYNTADYSVNDYDRGYEIYSSNIETDYTCETDYLDENISVWLRQLFLSKDVFVVFQNELFPVVITSSSFEIKTLSREKLIRHTLTFRKSIKNKVI